MYSTSLAVKITYIYVAAAVYDDDGACFVMSRYTVVSLPTTPALCTVSLGMSMTSPGSSITSSPSMATRKRPQVMVPFLEMSCAWSGKSVPVGNVASLIYAVPFHTRTCASLQCKSGRIILPGSNVYSLL